MRIFQLIVEDAIMLNKNRVFLIILISATSLLIFFAIHYVKIIASDYIVDDYAVSESGNSGNTIVRIHQDGKEEGILDARIDDYKVQDARIYIARTPRVIFERGDFIKSKFLPDCEFWIIDTKTHRLTKVEHLSNVKCW